jgi:hypothetical protein
MPPGYNGLGGVGAEVGIAVRTDLVKVGLAVDDFVGEPVCSRVGISVGSIVGSSVLTARQVS